LALARTLAPEGAEVATFLNWLANAEKASGDDAAAERDYREALRIAKQTGNREAIAAYTGNLAGLALDRRDWPAAEALAREALRLSEQIGRRELIGAHCARLAKALARQGRQKDALPHAQRAADIFTKLRSPSRLEEVQDVLKECEEA